jgi:hypothetical protein
MISLSLAGIIAYAKWDWKRFLTLGFEGNRRFNHFLYNLTCITLDRSLVRYSQSRSASVAHSDASEESNDEAPSTIEQEMFTLRAGARLRQTSITALLPRAQLYFSTVSLPYIYMWAVLLVYGFTSMHVQVITRFFSSMPPVFWFAAHLWFAASSTMPRLKADANQDEKPTRFWQIATSPSHRSAGSVWASAVLKYFIIYGLVGVVLFSNFFPPA